jgi:hypothetical protein
MHERDNCLLALWLHHSEVLTSLLYALLSQHLVLHYLVHTQNGIKETYKQSLLNGEFHMFCKFFMNIFVDGVYHFEYSCTRGCPHLDVVNFDCCPGRNS